MIVLQGAKWSGDLVLPFCWRLQKSGIWFSRTLKKQQVSHNVPPLFSAISPLRIEVRVSNMQPVSSRCFIKLWLVRLKIPNCCLLFPFALGEFFCFIFCCCLLHQTRDSWRIPTRKQSNSKFKSDSLSFRLGLCLFTCRCTCLVRAHMAPRFRYHQVNT